MDPGQRRRIRSYLWIGLLAGAVWLWYSASQRIRLLPPDGAVTASPVALVDHTGAVVDWGELAGRVVVVNLWASWCAPCRSEAEGLARLDQALGHEGVEILGINAEALEPDRLAAVRQDWDMPYRVASPSQSLVGSTFEGEGVVPHTWLVDRQGRVRASRAGWVSSKNLEAAVRPLLAE